MRAKQKPDIRMLFLMVLFILGLSFCIYLGGKNYDHLIDCQKDTHGVVLKFVRGVKGPGAVEYQYTVNGVTYDGYGGSLSLLEETGDMLTGRNFPVIYDSTKPDRSIILILKPDFWRVGINYPDSLAWVTDLLKEDASKR